MILIAVMAFILFGCYRTENGLVVGLPDYEKRHIAVTPVDLDILLKADTLLQGQSSWSKDGSRFCSDSTTLSLFCALQKASIEVTGKYVHRQPALQEVRFVIDDNYRSRWKVHRLADFNAHPDTRFNDVKTVIAIAIKNVKRKLAVAAAH